MHILAVFIVLGVGADDIFVFTDAWRQSASEPPHISASLETRMVFTYVRTAHAVFNTSFTTALAFAGTAVSPVMPIAAFGVFAAVRHCHEDTPPRHHHRHHRHRHHHLPRALLPIALPRLASPCAR